VTYILDGFLSPPSVCRWRRQEAIDQGAQPGLSTLEHAQLAAARIRILQLVSSRYENASVILTSNLRFGRWAEVFGDQTIAAAMIDRLVHHAEVHTLTGDSYRTKNRGIDTLASHKPENKTQ